MAVPETFPAGSSTGVSRADRTYVDPAETIGNPLDAPAATVSQAESAFAMLKGIAALLGVPAGGGDADTNNSARLFNDPMDTLGHMDDAPATDPSARNSAIALLKGICVELGL